MKILGDYPVYINKCSKVLALVPMGLSAHRARQKQGEWYDAAVVLRSVRQLHDLVGDDAMRRIGREIVMLVSRIESEVLEDLKVDSPESSIAAMPAFYARYHKECGGLEAQKIGENKFLVDDDTPYPESLNAGLLEGAVREFGGVHVQIACSQIREETPLSPPLARGEGSAAKRRYTVVWS